MNTKFTWLILNRFHNPLELSFLASIIFHNSSKNFIIWKDSDSFPIHFSLSKASLIFNTFLENYQPLSMKCVVFEFPVIFKEVVFEDTLLPGALLKISFKSKVWPIFLAITFKLTVFKITSIVVTIIFQS